MSSLKKISILSVLLVSMSIVGYGATVVVPRVPVVIVISVIVISVIVVLITIKNLLMK